MRQTSLIAYRKIKPDLGQKQDHILEVFRRTGLTFTNRELAQVLGWDINRVTPRVFELRDKGYLQEAGDKQCDVTGHRAMVWKLRGGPA
jgi:DNA-binding MarR family transcriptional regulator